MIKEAFQFVESIIIIIYHCIFISEVSMEPPMVSETCENITLDEENDPLCCGSAYPPSAYSNLPSDIQLETLDDSEMVYKDPLTLNTLKTASYSQTFFIKKEKDPEKVIYVNKEKDIDNDSKEQLLLRSELSDTSLDLPSNFNSDNVKVKLEFNEQNWGKMDEFNCSSLCNVDSSTDHDDTVNPMEYVSCQSVEHRNKLKASNTSESTAFNSNEIKSVTKLNGICISTEVLHNNLSKQISSSEQGSTFDSEFIVQDIKNSKYSVKILTDINHPNPCANSQMISKIASEVPWSFKSRMDDNIKKLNNQHNNKILISGDKSLKLNQESRINNESMIATTSHSETSKLPIKIKSVLKNTILSNFPTTLVNSASSSVNNPSKPPATIHLLKSGYEDKLLKSSTIVLEDKMATPKSPVNAATTIEKEEDQSISINQYIKLHDETRQKPNIWVNQDMMSSFKNSRQEARKFFPLPYCMLSMINLILLPYL
jgi:hypothetical protein